MSLDGELASLRSLAAKTLVNTRSAPLALGRTEETLQSLIDVLDIIATDGGSEASILKSDGSFEQRCAVLVNLCLASLNKLCASLRQSSNADTADIEGLAPSDSLRNDVEDAHRELLLRYNDIRDFVNNANMARPEKMDEDVGNDQEQEAVILDAVDKILADENMPHETSLVLSGQSNDHLAVWKHLRERLKLSGFKASDVERHKTTIFDRLHKSMHHVHRPVLPTTFSGQVERRADTPMMGSPRLVRPLPTSMSSHDYLPKHLFNRNSNYRPPAASTIYDGSDDDARSIASEASTLLGPVDDRLPQDQYALRPPTTVRPNSRSSAHTVEPRSPRTTFEMSEEKIVNMPSNPSSPRETQFRAWSNSNETARDRPIPRNTGPMARPNSPRERDQRYYPIPRPGSYSRNPTTNAKYDYDVLTGKRSVSKPAWKYRRNGDMLPPRNQSMDVQDYALPTAAADGRITEVQRLLSQGRNIESFGTKTDHQTKFDRTTALYRAAMQGHFEVVHLLLRSGANANPRRRDGKSLVRLLSDEGSVEMLRLLMEYRADVQHQGALPQAALFGHFNVVQLLLEYGADIDEVEKQTALYRASSNGYPAIVELLLREGANVHYTTATGHSALYKAVQNENYQCARILLSYGARPNVGTGRTGDSVLHVAAELGHEPTVRALLRRGASANECNGYQNAGAMNDRRRFPLHFAARGGHVAAARLLLDYGADVNALTDDGRGPVDIAIERGHDEVVDLLSRAGGFPQLAINERGSGHRGQDIEDPRRSAESQQLRRFSSSLPERPHRERRHSGLGASRSFEQEPKRREKSSTGSRRPDNASQQSSSSSRLNTTAAVSLLASSAMMLIGGG